MKNFLTSLYEQVTGSVAAGVYAQSAADFEALASKGQAPGAGLE